LNSQNKTIKKDIPNPKDIFYQDLNNVKRFLEIFEDNSLKNIVDDLNYRVSAYDYGFIDFILSQVNTIEYPKIFPNKGDNDIFSYDENPTSILINEVNKTKEFLISLYKHLSYEQDYLNRIKELKYKEGHFDKEINQITLSIDELIDFIQKMNLEELENLISRVSNNDMVDTVDTVLTPIEEVINYLKKNKNYIIVDIINKIETDNQAVYIYELNEKKVEFTESINSHFEWMIELLFQFDDKKVNIDNLSIIESLHIAYCDFYKEYLVYIEDIEQKKEVKKILQNFASTLSKKYKCD